MNNRIGIPLCIVVLLLAFCFLRSGRYPNTFSSAKPNCWIRCHNPATIVTLDDFLNELRSSINPQLSWLDRYSGFLTTPIFKMSGIQGWRDYGTGVSVEGDIKQVAHSLDGMTTLDLEVGYLSMTGHVSPPTLHRFLRVEVFGSVGRYVKTDLLVGNRVQVYGRLMWDGDGFLEVHPVVAADIRVLNSPPS